MRWLFRWFASWWTPPRYKDDPNYQRAQKFVNDEAARVPVEIAKLFSDHSLREFQILAKASDELDSKAEKLITLATTTGGALFLLFRDKPELTSWPFIASYLLLVGVVVVCLIARGPADKPTGMRADRLFLHCKREGVDESAVLHTIGCYYFAATEGLDQVNGWKAMQLKRAGFLLVLGFACLLVAIIPKPECLQRFFAWPLM